MAQMHVEQVDMMAAARSAQEYDAGLFAVPGAIKVVAPAKVNLYLEIRGKLPNGYHEVDTVMHALLLHDVLRMRRTQGELNPGSVPCPDCPTVGVQLTCRTAPGIDALDVAPQNNIVVKAVSRLAKAVDRSEAETVYLDLEKHIPAEAGLGGGSSDAAAALVGAAHLWGIAPDDERLEQVARTLGADVPFFLRGGCCRLAGVGDEFGHALTPLSSYVVLIKPAEGVSTSASYRAFDENPVTIPSADHNQALSARSAKDVPLRNNMTNASEKLLPAIRDVRTWATGQPGVSDALMSGSGSGVFACCDSLHAATNLVSAAQMQGWWARSTMFGPARAAIVSHR